MTTDEAEIRDRIETLRKGLVTGDVGALKTMFAPNLVSYDVEAPLRYLGAQAKLANWERAFALFPPPLGYDVRDLTVLVDGNLAVVHSLNRLTRTLPTGEQAGSWVRWTAAWQKIDGEWLIVHDQASFPTYFETGRAATDLTP
jgi:ketosteroid isomerase-like protein